MSTRIEMPHDDDPATGSATGDANGLGFADTVLRRSSVSPDEFVAPTVSIVPPPVDTGDLEFLPPDEDAVPLSEASSAGDYRVAEHPDGVRYLKQFAMQEIAEIDELQSQGKNKSALACGENYWNRSYAENFSWPRYLYLSEVAAKMCLLLDPIRDQTKLQEWHDRLKPIYKSLEQEVSRLEIRISDLEIELTADNPARDPAMLERQKRELRQMRSEHQDIKYYQLILYYIDAFFDKCREYLEASANPKSAVRLKDDGSHTFAENESEWQFEVSTWKMFARHIDDALGDNPVTLPESRRRPPSGAIPTRRSGGTALLPGAEDTSFTETFLARIADSLPQVVRDRITPRPVPQPAPTQTAQKPAQQRSPTPPHQLQSPELISLQPEYITALRLRASRMLLLLKRAVRRMDALTIAEENILRSVVRQKHGPTRTETVMCCRPMQRATREAMENNAMYLEGTQECRTPDGMITKKVPGFRGAERENSPLVHAVEISNIRYLIDIGEFNEAKQESDELVRKLNRLGETELSIQLNAIIGYGFLTFAQHLMFFIEKPRVAGAEEYRPSYGNKPVQDKLLEEAHKLGFDPEKHSQTDIASMFIDAGIKRLRDSNKVAETQKPEPNQNLMRRLRNELMFGISLKLRSETGFPADFQNGTVRGVIERAVRDLDDVDPIQRAQVYLPRIAEVLYWASVRKEPKFSPEKRLSIIAMARKYAPESLKFFDEEIGDPIDDDAITMEIRNVGVHTDFVLGRGQTVHAASGNAPAKPEPLPDNVGIEFDPGTIALGRPYHYRRGVPSEYFYLLHYRRAYVAAVARHQPTRIYPGARGR